MDRLTLKPQVIDFTALVWHHIVALLLLTHSCGGQSDVTDTPQPIVAVVGDDVILPCHLKVPGDVDAVGMTVEWARPDLEPRFVHLRRGGVELLLEEHPLYTGRTSLFIDSLKCGDISLKLSKVKLSDAGTYKCFVPTPGSESVVQLAVGSVSSPEVDMSSVSDGVLLECKSKGWYPEPELSWLDGEGNLLSAGPTETVRGPDDLYTVSRRLTVRKSDSFTCRVQQKNITQTRETHFRVPAELFVVQSSSAVRTTIIVCVCLVFVGAVVFVIWRVRQNENNKNKLLMERRTGSEKMKELDETTSKLEEDLPKKEEELEHVTDLMTTLTEQKKNLKEQREKFSSLLQDDKAQIEAIKKKIKDGYTMNKDKKMEKAEKKKAEMEERQKKHNELLQKTEKLQDTTEDLIIRMTERKAKIEKDKEQMKKRLTEVEKERETERKLELERSEREREEKKERDEIEMEHESEQSDRKEETVCLHQEGEKKEKNKNDPPSSDGVI